MESVPAETDTVVMHWSHTAKTALAELLSVDEQYCELLAQAKSNPHADYAPLMRLSFRIVRTASTVIVFSALTIEAFINYYAANRLGHEYASQFVDRLDLVAKWVVIPQLVLGRRVLEDGELLSDLTRLVALRNAVVHPKAGPSKPARVAKGLTSYVLPAAEGLREQALFAAEVVVRLATLLEDADPESDASFMYTSFDEDVEFSDDYSFRIEEVSPDKVSVRVHRTSASSGRPEPE